MNGCNLALTTWDLLKASAFYYTRHMESKLRTDRSTTLVFYVAGRELCYLKAMNQPCGRALAQSIYAILKPRKDKKARHAKETLLPMPEDESSEGNEEFFDVPDGVHDWGSEWDIEALNGTL